jgi:hypothetical protein
MMRRLMPWAGTLTVAIVSMAIGAAIGGAATGARVAAETAPPIDVSAPVAGTAHPKPPQMHSVRGRVIAKQDSFVGVRTPDGSTTRVRVLPQTVIRKTGERVTIELIERGDRVVAVGRVNENGVLLARGILVEPAALRPPGEEHPAASGEDGPDVPPKPARPGRADVEPPPKPARPPAAGPEPLPKPPPSGEPGAERPLPPPRPVDAGLEPPPKPERPRAPGGALPPRPVDVGGEPPPKPQRPGEPGGALPSRPPPPDARLQPPPGAERRGEPGAEPLLPAGEPGAERPPRPLPPAMQTRLAAPLATVTPTAQ